MDWKGEVYENSVDAEATVLTPLTDFPMVVSNSMRVAFVACPQKFFRSYIQGWSPSIPSVHLTAGKAFAKGMEITRRAYYERGVSETEAIALGYAEVIRAYGEIEYQWHKGKTATRMAEALLAYFEEYPLAIDAIKPLMKQDGTAAVEFTFAIPIPECIHPQTGEPIIHSGRFDMLGQHENGLLFVVDEKTTSQLGESWSKQWELNSQFTGYCLTPETEVLTPEGWLPIEQLQQGQKVAQWDTQENLRFVVPTQLHSPEYEGDLITCDGKVSFASTPTHRQIVWDTYSLRYKDYTSETLPKRTGAYRFLSAGYLQGGTPLGTDFVRLLVAIQADGSWKNDGALKFHFTKLRKAERLEALLDRLEVTYAKHNTVDGSFSYRLAKSCEIVTAAYSFLGHEKLFGPWLLSLSQSDLRAFLDEIQYWDGTTRDSRGIMYFSTVQSNADWVRTVAAITGHYSSWHTQPGFKSDKPLYRVNITEGRQHSPHLHTWGTQPYKGRVYCVTVPSSYFLIRHQGKTMVTGNCWASREYGYKTAGAIIRGISILKNSFGHASPMLYRAEWEIDRWYAQLVRDINRMITSYKEGYWDYNLAASCANYGGCHLLSVCSSNQPDRWLEAEFVVKKYDPLAPD